AAARLATVGHGSAYDEYARSRLRCRFTIPTPHTAANNPAGAAASTRRCCKSHANAAPAATYMNGAKGKNSFGVWNATWLRAAVSLTATGIATRTAVTATPKKIHTSRLARRFRTSPKT